VETPSIIYVQPFYLAS